MWNAQPDEIKLLDKRDSITVTSIRENSDWTTAFRQLRETATQKEKTVRRHKPIISHNHNFLDAGNKAVVNGYKLFYYRQFSGLSLKKISHSSGVDVRTINNLEQVKTGSSTGPNCFKTITREELAAIEQSIGCIGKLEYGQPDDFLAKFIMFYKVNKTIAKNKSRIKQLDFFPDTKAVVFDFGGTLTRTSSNRSTWEKMWEIVGYTSSDAGHYHRLYIADKIKHQEWCDITANELRKKGFSKEHLQQIISTIKPMQGLTDAINELRRQDTMLYIVSGSIKEIILEVLGKCFSDFSDIKANEIAFDEQGIIKSIRGTNLILMVRQVILNEL